MKYVILGGVAAGTKAAAKLKRCDRNAIVKVYTKGNDISYAGCGLPYYIGGDPEFPAQSSPKGILGWKFTCALPLGFALQSSQCHVLSRI